MLGSKSRDVARRIYGFDLVRTAVVLSILYFHVWQFSFYEDQISLSPESSSYYLLVDFVGVFFKYGGLFIVALSFFLIGLKEGRRHVRRFIVLLVGILGLQILSSENPADPQSWNWDVYSFLVLSYAVVMLLPKQPRLRLSLLVLSIVILSVPYEIYGPFLRIPEAVQFTGWNTVPWLALPILFHTLGYFWREKVPEGFLLMRPLEGFLWMAAMILFYVFCRDYGIFPVGPGFEGFIFKQKPLMFWQHFSIFMFLLRLSLDPRINAVLAKIAPVRWVSALRWNQRLGFCYLLQFAFLPLGPMLLNFWKVHPRLFDWLWLFIFAMVEVVARLVLDRKRLRGSVVS